MIPRPRTPKRFYEAKISDFSNLPDLGNVEAGGSYFITGTVGTGKTHLAAAILRLWCEKKLSKPGESDRHAGWGAAFISVPELLGHIQSTFKGKVSTAYMQSSFQEAGCLVLDDLGAEKMTEWSFSCLYRIISGRDAVLLPTVVTSNMTLSDIDEWEPRIASRLSGWRVIAMNGKDRRQGTFL